MITINATIRTVTANVAKKTVAVTLVFPMDEANMESAQALAFYANKMPVGVVVTPRQLELELKKDGGGE